MNRDQIVTLINKNPICFVATADGDQPRVRAVMTLRADERGILFNTGKAKDLHHQIEANSATELCFYDPADRVQVRVSGRLELQNDAETHRLVLEKLPFLKPLVEAKGTEILAPYLLRHGRATVWTMATNMAPKTCIDF
jgi:pyridoxamine 5'-phosphate oxidase